jgi:hypothetical protein
MGGERERGRRERERGQKWWSLKVAFADWPSVKLDGGWGLTCPHLVSSDEVTLAKWRNNFP